MTQRIDRAAKIGAAQAMCKFICSNGRVHERVTSPCHAAISIGKWQKRNGKISSPVGRTAQGLQIKQYDPVAAMVAVMAMAHHHPAPGTNYGMRMN